MFIMSNDHTKVKHWTFQKKQIRLIVLSLGGVLDARKTHTVAGRKEIRVDGSYVPGIGGSQRS